MRECILNIACEDEKDQFFVTQEVLDVSAELLAAVTKQDNLLRSMRREHGPAQAPEQRNESPRTPQRRAQIDR